MMSDLDVLAQAVHAAEGKFLVVVTGAGISLASGIPTFRGQDKAAVWRRDVTELGTFRYFLTDPVGSWRWYLERFDRVFAALPNPAHHALVALEAWQRQRGGSFLLVTQNIDTLHEQAGARDHVKVHGSADRVRCPSEGCRYGSPTGSLPRDEAGLAAFRREPNASNLPRCPACGTILRQHVLWFDESYDSHADYQWERVCEAGEQGDLFLFVGTSFSVGVTEYLVQSALARRRPVLSVDPHAVPVAPMITGLRTPAELLLPALVERLAGEALR
jgi:NAD-dependent deacetylase